MEFKFKFKLQHISYSRPNNFRGFNSNSETSCIFVAIGKPLICAFVTAMYCKINCSVLTFITCVLSVKLHYTDTGYEHRLRGRVHNNSTTCRTTNSPSTDKKWPHPNILTCGDVGLWHCHVQIGKFVVELLAARCWWCPLVVLYNMSVAGVHVVEFGPKL